jgi:hypothetical protein
VPADSTRAPPAPASRLPPHTRQQVLQARTLAGIARGVRLAAPCSQLSCGTMRSHGPSVAAATSTPRLGPPGSRAAATRSAARRAAATQAAACCCQRSGQAGACCGPLFLAAGLPLLVLLTCRWCRPCHSSRTFRSGVASLISTLCMVTNTAASSAARWVRRPRTACRPAAAHAMSAAAAAAAAAAAPRDTSAAQRTHQQCQPVQACVRGHSPPNREAAARRTCNTPLPAAHD